MCIERLAFLIWHSKHMFVFQLLMFEKHLSSNSIGFSVFGLFVIDRTTAPKVCYGKPLMITFMVNSQSNI